MRLTDKTEKFSSDINLVGKRKNYIIHINYAAENIITKESFWWFSLRKDDVKYSFNSLHEKLKFATQEECIAACENKINELTKL